MANQVIKTVLELQLLSGGVSCAPVLDYLDAAYPGWTLDTEVNVLTYCEGIRAAGSPWAVTYGIYRALTESQREEFLQWGLNKLLTIYSTQDLVDVKEQITNYLETPSPESASQLLADSESLNSAHRIESAVKAAALIVTHGEVTASHLQNLETAIKKGALNIQQTPMLDSVNEILTQLEIITGLIDA